ncbi:hypothetical protein SNEBB_010193 [Seison nebaliae]|nr:hypothetical protein SNEBB_010193 [Seison nebaliae]
MPKNKKVISGQSSDAQKQSRLSSNKSRDELLGINKEKKKNVAKKEKTGKGKLKKDLLINEEKAEESVAGQIEDVDKIEGPQSDIVKLSLPRDPKRWQKIVKELYPLLRELRGSTISLHFEIYADMIRKLRSLGQEYPQVQGSPSGKVSGDVQHEYDEKLKNMIPFIDQTNVDVLQSERLINKIKDFWTDVGLVKKKIGHATEFQLGVEHPKLLNQRYSGLSINPGKKEQQPVELDLDYVKVFWRVPTTPDGLQPINKGIEFIHCEKYDPSLMVDDLEFLMEILRLRNLDVALNLIAIHQIQVRKIWKRYLLTLQKARAICRTYIIDKKTNLPDNIRSSIQYVLSHGMPVPVSYAFADAETFLLGTVRIITKFIAETPGLYNFLQAKYLSTITVKKKNVQNVPFAAPTKEVCVDVSTSSGRQRFSKTGGKLPSIDKKSRFSFPHQCTSETPIIEIIAKEPVTPSMEKSITKKLQHLNLNCLLPTNPKIYTEQLRSGEGLKFVPITSPKKLVKRPVMKKPAMRCYYHCIKGDR